MTLPPQLIKLQKRLFEQMPKSILQLQPEQSGYDSNPDYNIRLKLFSGQIDMIINRIVVASSNRTIQLQEDFHLPVYYFPKEDVRMDLMQRTSLITYCPFKGYASYWALHLGEKIFKNVVWSYENPFEQVSIIQNYVSFDLSQDDFWYQNSEDLYKDYLTTEI